jgi:endonuclease YncB( thermonuclease family)
MTLRLLLIVSALLLSPPAIAASIISGSAYVIDGDSLSVSAISVRLFGIDALEGAQTCTRDGQAWACGEESASQLRALIGERSVRCQGFGVDDYGRTLAICHTGSVELNSAMVSAGWATAFRKYSTL